MRAPEVASKIFSETLKASGAPLGGHKGGPKFARAFAARYRWLAWVGGDSPAERGLRKLAKLVNFFVSDGGGAEEDVRANLGHLSRLVCTLRPYYHPSNAGSWTPRLALLMSELSRELVAEGCRSPRPMSWPHWSHFRGRKAAQQQRPHWQGRVARCDGVLPRELAAKLKAFVGDELDRAERETSLGLVPAECRFAEVLLRENRRDLLMPLDHDLVFEAAVGSGRLPSTRSRPPPPYARCGRACSGLRVALFRLRLAKDLRGGERTVMVSLALSSGAV